MFLCLFILEFAINHLLCWMWWGRGLLKILNAYFLNVVGPIIHQAV